MYSKIKYCGICCAIMSTWAVIQLTIMGFCFHYETFPFLEEAMEYSHDVHVENLDQFVENTKENYHKIARNCWFAAAMYGCTLLLSFICIGVAKKRTKSVFSAKDEDLFCSTEAGKFVTIGKTVEAEKGKKTKSPKAPKSPRKMKDDIKAREKQEKKEKQLKEKQEKKDKKQEEKKKNFYLGQTYRNK